MHKQYLRRTIGFLLCLAMVVALLPAMSLSVVAEESKAADPVDELQAQAVTDHSEKLTEWKIAPSAGDTTLGLPAMDDWNAVVASDENWYEAAVPGTVLGNLLDNGVYDHLFTPNNDGEIDVFFSDNMSKIPMTDFDSPWWYSTEFALPELQAGDYVNIQFQGISYTGEIYVNGHKLSNKNITITSDQELQNDLGVVGNDTIGHEGFVDPTSTTPIASSLTPYPNSVSFDSYKNLFLGSFRYYDVDISEYVHKDGTPNEIKVKVTKPMYKSDTSDSATSGDFTSFWVDWNPQPADSNMGLTGNVIVSVSGPVRLSNPAAVAKVSEELDSADMTFYLDVNNMTGSPVRGTLTGVIKAPDGSVVDTVKKLLVVDAGVYCQEVALEYTMSDPELWWPYMYGDQPLYTIEYTFETVSSMSDTLAHRFGVREITTEVNISPIANGNNNYMMQLYVNHQPIVLKGGGYCPTDIYLRHSERDNKAVVEYVKYMGMNMVRDEGKFFDNDLLDMFDENGILLMTGWCCCDRHQNSSVWTKAERFVAYEALYSQIRNARSHASSAVWFNGSDRPPTPMVEHKYLEIEGRLRWTEMASIVSSGSAVQSTYTGVYGGMHMDATYDSQTPNFYYTDTRGNFGFISEGGGGAGIPVIESIRKVIPEANEWPYNVGENANIWNYHASRQNFNQFNQVTSIIDNTYGQSESLEEFAAKAQIFDYDTQRAQYEALSMFRFANTSGLVNWMLNNAWPIFYWNQFDYYLNPHGSTYGVRKGNEPVHIMYDTYNKKICVINNTLEDYSDLTATMSIYDINGNLISTELSKAFDLDPVGASEPVESSRGEITPRKIGFGLDEDGNLVDAEYNYNGMIEESYGIEYVWNYDEIMDSLTKPTSDVYFIRLELKDDSGKVISYNAYAEPMRSDVPGASHSWSRSAVYQTADLTQLNQLPAVSLNVSQTAVSKVDGKVIQTISINNPTDHVAYGVEVKAYTDNLKTDLVAPVIYSDNLITLFPGETRVITISHNTEDLDGNAVISVNCYNNIISGNANGDANIYRGIDVGAQGTNNLARDAAVSLDGLTGNTNNLTAVSSAAKTAALNGNTFIDSNIYAVYTSGNDDEGSFIIDLGSVQSFDRVMLRWNRSANTINHRPNNVKIEVSSDGTIWTQVGDHDNTTAGAVMTNIVLTSQATGQYLRITPSGRRSIAPAVGLVLNQYPFTSRPIGGGIAEVAAPRTYICSGVEVYAYRDSAYLEIYGEGTVTAGGKSYDGDMNANERVVQIGTDGSLTLDFASTKAYKVYSDGTEITGSLVGNTLSLTGLTEDTDITVRFGGHVVTYNSNGGSDMGAPVTVDAGNKLTKPADPTKGGYNFVGWYSDSELTIAWNFDANVVREDMTLYAKWAEQSDFEQKLTKWKIAPTAENTTTHLPELKDDAKVASPDFNTDSWIDAVAPGTVLGNLLDAGVYDHLFTDNNDGEKDVFFGDNLSKVPYLDFEKAWWYSTDFELPADQAGKEVNINFQGISYVGEIYVNGHKLSNENITVSDLSLLQNDLDALGTGTGFVDPTYTSNAAASSLAALGYTKDDNRTDVADRVDPQVNFDAYKDKFIGSFRHYDLDITDYVVPGETVNIKVKVTRPIYRWDLNSFWVDWNPEPPDNNMGLTGAVIVSTSGAVRLSNPAVASKVSTALDSADLTFYVDANNMTSTAVTGTLKGTIKAPNGAVVETISKSGITVAANAYCQEIAVTCHMNNPELWWPYLSGDQPLYTIDYEFVPDGGGAGGSLTNRFGIREISTEVNVSAKAHAQDADMMQIYVNHKPVMLRGGGYCPTDLFLRHDQQTNEAVVDYIKYMGMNMIRDEGKFFDNDLLDLMDENGILLMTGWCCCDQFQQSQNWRMSERFVGYESQYSQLRNARSHTSMALWFNGSDNPPTAMVEYAYFRIEADLRWNEMGAICSNGSSPKGGSNKVSELTGVAGGMHMDATYDSQTPTFYYTDPAGTFGFVSEGGGGAAIPVIETIDKIIPKANQWPYNTVANYNIWNYHTCRGGFNNLNHFTSFLDNTYGGSESLEEYVARAQIFDYDAQRAQYESQALHRYTSTAGIVNWMMNNAWPLLYWNQFDFYMNPHGSTFGTRKANEPVHIMYNVYDKEVYVINNTLESYSGMTATIRLYDINGNLISSPLTKTLNVAADGASTPVAEGSAGREAIEAKWTSLDYDDSTGKYVKHTYNYNGQIKEAYGVNKLWSYEDIQDSMSAATSDVYFIRLELADSSGKVVSYNSYTEGMRGDVAGANHSWNRSRIYQNADLTQLNQLPRVNLNVVQTGSEVVDDTVVQTLNVTNPTESIAYAVELKAYMDGAMTDLVAPVFYSDNLFTLYPGETREITITHNTRDLAGDAVISINCYNNVIQGEKPEKITNIYAGKDQTGSFNLAKNAEVTRVVGSGGTPANATAVSASAENNAAASKTFIECDLNTEFRASAGELSFVVDLGSVKSFDRIIARWSVSAGVLNARPDYVLIEASADNENWTELATYDNTKAAAVMTDIVLDDQATAQYIRVTPSGHMGTVAAVGMADLTGVTGYLSNRSGIAQLNAANYFTCSGFEVYTFTTDFTVSFDTGDEGSDVDNLGANSGEKLKAPAEPTREGYTFGGWYKDSGLTNPWDFGVDTVTTNLVLYAKWDALPEEFQVTFETGDGSDVDPVTVVDGDKLIKPADPDKEGYTFGGWYKDSGLTTAWDFDVDTVTEGLKLYAKWVPIPDRLTVSFDTGGGSFIAFVRVTEGDKVMRPTDPIRSGYVFAGWYKDSSLSSPWDFDIDTVTESMTLYAKWSEALKEYTVYYNSNGGSVISSATVVGGAKAVKPADPTRDGYTFGGWYKDGGLAYAWNFDVDTVTENVTLYAKWDAVIVRYTVGYNSNGGSAVSPETVVSGDKLTKPADPTRSGYTFDGWYKDSSLNYAWDFGLDVVTRDVTLYAKWNEIIVPAEYTVSFDSNGGSAVPSATVISGNKVTKPTDPTRGGHAFAGWYRDSGLKYAWDFDNDAVTKAITLYAKWDEIPVPVEYTVSFDSNGGSAVASVKVVSGGKITRPDVPINENLIFAGWYKDSELRYEWDFDSDTVTKDTVLYAMWYTPQEGTVIITDIMPDGTVVTREYRENDVWIETTTTPDGKTTSQVIMPEGEEEETVVCIPVRTYSSGNVAYVINDDGTKDLVEKSYVTESGVYVPVDCSTNLEIVDNTKPFNDVKSTDWYNSSVIFVSSHELFQGTADKIFSPNLPLTRSMLVTVLHRLEGMPTGAKGTFPDVPASTWYTSAVAWAKETGITVGTDKGLFEPEANITRESLAAMLYRYAELIDMDTSARTDYGSFRDANSVSSWAKDAMSWAVARGIITGTDDNRINPSANATRAEAAAMIMRFVISMYK